MAKKKGKRDEPKTKASKAKKKVSAREPKGIKGSGGSGKGKKATSKRKPAKKSNPKKSPFAKKSLRGKTLPPKKASSTQKRVRKPPKVSPAGGGKKAKNKAPPARIKKRKRSSKPFKLGKRVPDKKRSTEWNYIAKASKKIPKRAKYITRTLTGSKDKSRRSEFFGKRFRIKKTVQVYKPRPINDSAFDFLVKRNIRALKINGKTEKKAYLKAMYIDSTGAIRWTSVTREVLKTKQDVEDKVRLLIFNLKGYGDVKLLGFESEEVLEEWDADEDMGDSEF